MTMPHERARALRFAGEMLRDLLTTPDVLASVTQEARVTLRHYPTPLDLRNMLRDVHELTRLRAESDMQMNWLEPEENQK